jgi:hypothetical protein
LATPDSLRSLRDHRAIDSGAAHVQQRCNIVNNSSWPISFRACSLDILLV